MSWYTIQYNYVGDGPVYESIQTQHDENNETELQSEDTRDQQYDNIQLGFLLYVDQPVHSQYLYTNAALSSNTNDSVETLINRSASVSMLPETPGVIALKKNRQERSKLHLTLSLGGNDSSNNHTRIAARNSMPKICDVAPKDVD